MNGINNGSVCSPTDGFTVSLPVVPDEDEEEAIKWADEQIKDWEIRDQDRRRQDSLSTICKNYERTDLGNSYRFLSRYGDVIRYCHQLKRWYVWTGINWQEDSQGVILDLARKTVIKIGDEAAKTDGDHERAEMFKWAGSSQGYTRIKNLVALSTIPKVSVSVFDLDSKQDLLNFPNCTLNLDDLTPKPHNKEDMLSMVMGTEYNSGAQCPKWEQQMETVFEGDQEKIRFFQEFCGYHLLADHPMQCMYIHYGDGKNGRSVVFRVLETILGDYCGTFPTELLLHHRNKDANPRPQPELLAKIKCRMLIAKETDKGRFLSEGAIKRYTGGDGDEARLLHDNTMQKFSGTFKINLLTNNMPRVRGTDTGIRRRLVKIPYRYMIPEKDRRPFDIVVRELCEEGPGIVNWMIEGLKRVQENGRTVSLIGAVVEATDSYLQKEDNFGRFLFDEAIVRDDIPNDDCATPTAMITAYRAWAEKEGEEPMRSKDLKDEMVRRFGEQVRDMKRRFYRGVRLKTEQEKERGEDLGARQNTLCHDNMTSHDGLNGKLPMKEQYSKLGINPVMGCHAVIEPAKNSGISHTIPTTKSDAFDLLIGVKGDFSKLTKEQYYAIKDLWVLSSGDKTGREKDV